jgi:hypothetical protein
MSDDRHEEPRRKDPFLVDLGWCIARYTPGEGLVIVGPANWDRPGDRAQSVFVRPNTAVKRLKDFLNELELG